MKFPSVIVSAVIVGVLAVLNHLLNHVGAFGLSELYAPIVVAILTTLIKMVQEWTPTADHVESTARGFEVVEDDSYAARVLWK